MGTEDDWHNNVNITIKLLITFPGIEPLDFRVHGPSTKCIVNAWLTTSIYSY